MSMVSMKMSAEEAKKSDMCYAEGSNPPEYPYGLEIRLDDAGLAKLGMSAPPQVGAELVITAKVTVVSSSQYQRQGNEAEMSSCWQITDMEVSAGSTDWDQVAKKMYPNQV